MKKLKNKLILLFPVFTLILAFTLSAVSIFAEGKYEITLELKSSEEAEVGTENIDFEIWKLKEDEGHDHEVIFEKLKNCSRKELNDKYGEPVKEVSSGGKHSVKISGLKSGKYYLRDKNYKRTGKYYSPVVFELPNQHSLGFTMKMVKIEPGGSGGGNNKTPKNGIRFIKIADNKEKTPLKGAVFKVTRKVDGKDKAVQKDGEDYIVTSGDDGNFFVEDLEYGDYCLWEVKPPKGYKSLMNKIEFTIDKDSNTEKNIIEIVNKKDDEGGGGEDGGGKTDKTPEKKDEPKEDKKTPTTGGSGNIPQTGDVMLLLLSIEGIVLTLIGYLVVRSEKKKVLH